MINQHLFLCPNNVAFPHHAYRRNSDRQITSTCNGIACIQSSMQVFYILFIHAARLSTSRVAVLTSPRRLLAIHHRPQPRRCSWPCRYRHLALRLSQLPIETRLNPSRMRACSHSPSSCPQIPIADTCKSRKSCLPRVGRRRTPVPSQYSVTTSSKAVLQCSPILLARLHRRGHGDDVCSVW